MDEEYWQGSAGTIVHSSNTQPDPSIFQQLLLNARTMLKDTAVEHYYSIQLNNGFYHSIENTPSQNGFSQSTGFFYYKALIEDLTSTRWGGLG
jgi:hypothetical protein